MKSKDLEGSIKLFLSKDFKSADSIDSIVPEKSGLYCIRLKKGSKLPSEFQSILDLRDHNIIYIGKASKDLKKRMLNQELRHKGHGTFFRSLGAILGYLPPKGSLIDKSNKNNYKFSTSDTSKIVEWINKNLEVNWIVLPNTDLDGLEELLIKKCCPLLNSKGNPKKLVELEKAREMCRIEANTSIS